MVQQNSQSLKMSFFEGNPDRLVLIWAIAFFVSWLIETLGQLFEVSSEGWLVFCRTMYIISNITLILPVLFLKNKLLRIIAIVAIAIVIILYNLEELSLISMILFDTRLI